ncbi:MAG: dicarboxylate/amino acid:cation symporter [Planctomycetota bacterium]|jgi:Na+/H+-dicarboxylate symporter
MKLKIHTQIIIAIILGIIAGLFLKEKAEHLQIIGDLFIRLLKMIIIPLILASVVNGITQIGNIRNLGRIGLKTFIYYLTTTILAVTIGLILVNLIQPGTGAELADKATELPEQAAPSFITIITDIIPQNLFESMANDKVLQIIFFAILLGAAISSVGEKAKSISVIFEAANTVIMKIIDWIMHLAPIGVFALMAVTIGKTGLDVIKPLGLYMTTVIAGLLIHAFVILPVLLFIFARHNPLRFIKEVFSAVATAFSTASSAATLPITMECLEKNTGVSNKVSSFVLPLGATVNMDGTALYEAVAAMFIAQTYGIELSFTTQLIIVLTATLASIGAAAIPSAGLITLVIVLKAVNLPLEGIGMILAVDRLLDMCRTAVNVWGDSCGTVIIAHLEGEKLKAI